MCGISTIQEQKNPVQSYTTNNQKGSIHFVDNKFIKIPKVKLLIRIKIHIHLIGMIKSSTISRHSSGKYYTSLLCKEEISKWTETKTASGIDLGITDFAILSNGQKIDNNKFTFKMERKLKREQRKLSRRALLAKKRAISLFEAKNYQENVLVLFVILIMTEISTLVLIF